MKKILILTFILALHHTCVCVAEEIKKEFTIAAGEEKIIKIPKLKGLSNGGDIVEDVILQDGESVMFRATSWGQTQITAWDNLGKQYIFQINVEVPKYVQELQTFLQSIEGVKLSFLGRNIIVEGQILRQSDIAKLKGILATFPQVKNMVNMEVPTTESVLLESLKMELNNQNIKTSPLGGEGLIIEGHVLSSAEKKKLETLIPFYFKSVYPTITVSPIDLKISSAFALLSKEGVKSDNGSIATYIKTASLNASYSIVPFTFFDAFAHADIINTLVGESGAKMIESMESSVNNTETVSLTMPLNPSHNLHTAIKAHVIDRNWIDLELSLSIHNQQSELASKKERLVLKNGRGVALVGINEWLQKEIPSTSGDITVANHGNMNDYHCIFVITPMWNLKN